MNKRGLSTVEFAVIFAIVAIGTVTMLPYLRRAIEGHWKSNSDNFSEAQYDNETSSEPAWWNLANKRDSTVQLVNPKLDIDVSGKDGAILNIASGNVTGKGTGGGSYSIQAVNLNSGRANILQLDNWGTFKKD